MNFTFFTHKFKVNYQSHRDHYQLHEQYSKDVFCIIFTKSFYQYSIMIIITICEAI